MPRDKIHYLIIPKKHICDISHLDYKDKETALELMLMVQKLSNLPGFSKFRLIQNNGELALQTQFHIHIHFRVRPEHFNTPIPVYIKPLQCDFCNIITGLKPATIIEETDTIIVIDQEEFRRLGYEKAKHTIHWRIIPKKHIADLSQLNPEDHEMVVQMLFMAQALSQKSSDTQQFRLFNNADPALAWKQASHLHFDFTAGYKEKTNPKPRITSRTEPSSTTLTTSQALILGGIVVTGALVASKKGDCCIS
jgi:histidine triad (HIT) family protein